MSSKNSLLSLFFLSPLLVVLLVGPACPPANAGVFSSSVRRVAAEKAAQRVAAKEVVGKTAAEKAAVEKAAIGKNTLEKTATDKAAIKKIESQRANRLFNDGKISEQEKFKKTMRMTRRGTRRSKKKR